MGEPTSPAPSEPLARGGHGESGLVLVSATGWTRTDLRARSNHGDPGGCEAKSPACSASGARVGTPGPVARTENAGSGRFDLRIGIEAAVLYFPTSSVVSLLYVLENGSSAEIAVVGFEGIVGVSLFMGGMTTPSRAIVQSAGDVLLLGAGHVQEEFHRGGPLQQLLLATRKH